MRLVTPITVNSADVLGVGTILTATNVAEESTYTLWTASTRTLGERRYYGHLVYEVIVASTTDRPDTGAALATPSWAEVQPTNRWAMFDSAISTQTVNSASIVVGLTPAAIINGVAAFGLVGVTFRVVMVDPTAGTVYDQTIDLLDTSSVIDWYTYFFEDIQYREDVTLLDLPSYPSAVTTVTIANGTSDAKCGALVGGRQRDLGVAVFGTSVRIKSYSVKTTDDFGNVSITPRAYAKLADYDVTVRTDRIYIVQRQLADIRDTVTVFVGDEDRDETVIMGFLTDFNIVLSGPVQSQMTLQVEGLV